MDQTPEDQVKDHTLRDKFVKCFKKIEEEPVEDIFIVE